MQALTKLRRGFGIVEIVLIVAVVAIIAGLGYWAMNGSKPVNRTSVVTKQTISTKSDVTKAKTSVDSVSVEKDLDPSSFDGDLSDLK